MSIEHAIRAKRNYSKELDTMMIKELERMYLANEKITVTQLARNCGTTPATVYHHQEVFNKLAMYRSEQYNLRFRNTAK